MPATLSTKTRYAYNPANMRYRDTRTGRYVKASTVKRSLSIVVRKTREEMRRLAGDLADRKISLGKWQEQFAAELKLLHTSAAMVGAGGMANMTPADYGKVGARLRFEYDRLAKFARQLKAREFTRTAFLARVEMYCNAGQVSFEAAREDAAAGAGMDEEINRLGPREKHCTNGNGRAGCLDLTRMGWVPLGTLVPVGHRRCLASCGCSKAYRKRRAPMVGLFSATRVTARDLR